MFSKKQELNEILKKIAIKMTKVQNSEFKEHCPIGIIDIENWEWPQGVGMYGLYRYYKKTGDKEWLDYILGWYERRIAEGLPPKNINTMAPMLTLAFLYEETKEKRYLEICSEWAEWVMNELPRTRYGGFQHVVSGGLNEQQLWDDTLFMSVLFLAKIGVVMKRKDYIDETVKQFLIHIQYLFDKATGLWYHGWTFDGRHNFAKALWARGNSWITAGIPDYIEIVELDDGVKQFLVDTLKAQIEALAQYQREDGMWHTLINIPDSYVESSATAGFGYGILKAVRLGYVDEKYKAVGEKAIDAVVKRTLQDGTVTEVSYGTALWNDLEKYKNVPLCTMTYGQALAILLLCEGLSL